MKKALDIQVGGGHYKDLAIQPVEYNHANGLGYLEGNVVKYVTRHKAKNGAQDIRKAIHYLELVLQLEYADVDEMAFKHTLTDAETTKIFDEGEKRMEQIGQNANDGGAYPLTKEELSTENWYCLQHDLEVREAFVSLGLQVWAESYWGSSLDACCMADSTGKSIRPYDADVLEALKRENPDAYEIRLINGQFYRA
ncbi:MAG TPA: DUF3310 domain-containing protein [Pseudomonadales bacterium]|nr:DUF3310 domain-containing protein [Pseudomonadales bacterium]